MIIEIIAVLGALLLGYCLGKHTGRIIGHKEGKSVTALLLREKSLEQGVCALCHRSYCRDETGSV